MARTALHTSDLPIEQAPPVNIDAERISDIVQAGEDVLKKEYADELKFNEEPVDIRIEPSQEENAPDHVFSAVNGKGAEIFVNGQWIEITYLPVGQNLTVKRKTVANLATSKRNRIETAYPEPGAKHSINVAHKRTSAAHVFSVLHDPNPRGPAWLKEVIRRNV
jgi:hypothetical protein